MSLHLKLNQSNRTFFWYRDFSMQRYESQPWSIYFLMETFHQKVNDPEKISIIGLPMKLNNEYDDINRKKIFSK